MSRIATKMPATMHTTHANTGNGLRSHTPLRWARDRRQLRHDSYLHIGAPGQAAPRFVHILISPRHSAGDGTRCTQGSLSGVRPPADRHRTPGEPSLPGLVRSDMITFAGCDAALLSWS